MSACRSTLVPPLSCASDRNCFFGERCCDGTCVETTTCAVSDAGSDAGADSGGPGADAAPDSGPDAADASPDAAPDASPDAAPDASPDAAAQLDAGPPPSWQVAVLLDPPDAGFATDLSAALVPPSWSTGAQYIWTATRPDGKSVYTNSVQPWSGPTTPPVGLASYSDAGGVIAPRFARTGWTTFAYWLEALGDGGGSAIWSSYSSPNENIPWQPPRQVASGSAIAFPTAVMAPPQGPSEFGYLVAWLPSLDGGVIEWRQSDGGLAWEAPGSFVTGDSRVVALHGEITGANPIVFQGCNQAGPDLVCRIAFITRMGGQWYGPYRVDTGDGGVFDGKNQFEPLVSPGISGVFSWKKESPVGVDIWGNQCASNGYCNGAVLIGTAQDYPRDAGAAFDRPSFDIAANDSEEVAVAWVDVDAGVFVSRRDSQNRWETQTLVAPRGATRPRLAVTTSGRIVVAWVAASRVFARWYSKSANYWFDPVEISAGGPDGGERESIVAVGESAFAAWLSQGRVFGAWSPPP